MSGSLSKASSFLTATGGGDREDVHAYFEDIAVAGSTSSLAPVRIDSGVKQSDFNGGASSSNEESGGGGRCSENGSAQESCSGRKRKRGSGQNAERPSKEFRMTGSKRARRNQVEIALKEHEPVECTETSPEHTITTRLLDSWKEDDEDATRELREVVITAAPGNRMAWIARPKIKETKKNPVKTILSECEVTKVQVANLIHGRCIGKVLYPNPKERVWVRRRTDSKNGSQSSLCSPQKAGALLAEGVLEAKESPRPRAEVVGEGPDLFKDSSTGESGEERAKVENGDSKDADRDWKEETMTKQVAEDAADDDGSSSSSAAEEEEEEDSADHVALMYLEGKAENLADSLHRLAQYRQNHIETVEIDEETFQLIRFSRMNSPPGFLAEIVAASEISQALLLTQESTRSRRIQLKGIRHQLDKAHKYIQEQLPGFRVQQKRHNPASQAPKRTASLGGGGHSDHAAFLPAGASSFLGGGDQHGGPPFFSSYGSAGFHHGGNAVGTARSQSYQAYPAGRGSGSFYGSGFWHSASGYIGHHGSYRGRSSSYASQGFYPGSSSGGSYLPFRGGGGYGMDGTFLQGPGAWGASSSSSHAGSHGWADVGAGGQSGGAGSWHPVAGSATSWGQASAYSQLPTSRALALPPPPPRRGTSDFGEDFDKKKRFRELDRSGGGNHINKSTAGGGDSVEEIVLDSATDAKHDRKSSKSAKAVSRDEEKIASLVSEIMKACPGLVGTTTGIPKVDAVLAGTGKMDHAAKSSSAESAVDDGPAPRNKPLRPASGLNAHAPEFSLPDVSCSGGAPAPTAYDPHSEGESLHDVSGGHGGMLEMDPLLANLQFVASQLYGVAPSFAEDAFAAMAPAPGMWAGSHLGEHQHQGASISNALAPAVSPKQLFGTSAGGFVPLGPAALGLHQQVVPRYSNALFSVLAEMFEQSSHLMKRVLFLHASEPGSVGESALNGIMYLLLALPPLVKLVSGLWCQQTWHGCPTISATQRCFHLFTDMSLSHAVNLHTIFRETITAWAQESKIHESQKDRVTISFLDFFLTTLQHESEKAGGDTADAIQSLFSLQAQNGKNCLSLDIHLSRSNSILPLETEIQKEISYSDPEDGLRKDALLQAPACLIVNVNREQEGDKLAYGSSMELPDQLLGSVRYNLCAVMVEETTPAVPPPPESLSSGERGVSADTAAASDKALASSTSSESGHKSARTARRPPRLPDDSCGGKTSSTKTGGRGSPPITSSQSSPRKAVAIAGTTKSGVSRGVADHLHDRPTTNGSTKRGSCANSGSHNGGAKQLSKMASDKSLLTSTTSRLSTVAISTSRSRISQASSRFSQNTIFSGARERADTTSSEGNITTGSCQDREGAGAPAVMGSAVDVFLEAADDDLYATHFGLRSRSADDANTSISQFDTYASTGVQTGGELMTSSSSAPLSGEHDMHGEQGGQSSSCARSSTASQQTPPPQVESLDARLFKVVSDTNLAEGYGERDFLLSFEDEEILFTRSLSDTDARLIPYPLPTGRPPVVPGGDDHLASSTESSGFGGGVLAEEGNANGTCGQVQVEASEPEFDVVVEEVVDHLCPSSSSSDRSGIGANTALGSFVGKPARADALETSTSFYEYREGGDEHGNGSSSTAGKNCKKCNTANGWNWKAGSHLPLSSEGNILNLGHIAQEEEFAALVFGGALCDGDELAARGVSFPVGVGQLPAIADDEDECKESICGMVTPSHGNLYEEDYALRGGLPEPICSGRSRTSPAGIGRSVSSDGAANADGAKQSSEGENATSGWRQVSSTSLESVSAPVTSEPTLPSTLQSQSQSSSSNDLQKVDTTSERPVDASTTSTALTRRRSQKMTGGNKLRSSSSRSPTTAGKEPLRLSGDQGGSSSSSTSENLAGAGKLTDKTASTRRRYYKRDPNERVYEQGDVFGLQ
eukprot:g10883.t1